MYHLLMGHLPPNHDVGRVMASMHPRKIFLHLTGRLSINLVVLVVVLLFDGEYFLVHEESVFVPILGIPLEETLCSCPSDHLQSRSKARFMLERAVCETAIIRDTPMFHVCIF